MAVAGTRGPRDVVSDVLALAGQPDVLPGSRYRTAAKALHDHPEVDRVVGHSLGGYIASELADSDVSGVAYNPAVPLVQPLPGGAATSVVRDASDLVSLESAFDPRTRNVPGRSKLVHFADPVQSALDAHSYAHLPPPRAKVLHEYHKQVLRDRHPGIRISDRPRGITPRLGQPLRETRKGW